MTSFLKALTLGLLASMTTLFTFSTGLPTWVSNIFYSWEFLICMAQCQSNTLNAPADKLFLSEFKKVQGHSAISGH